MSGPKQEKIERVRWQDRVKGILRRLLPLLGLYLDDLLMVSAGVCFTTAAGLSFGLSAALTVAGACLLVYSVVVARARKDGDNR